MSRAKWKGPYLENELINQINMKENAKGIYFIKVAIDKEVFYKKINLH